MNFIKFKFLPVLLAPLWLSGCSEPDPEQIEAQANLDCLEDTIDDTYRNTPEMEQLEKDFMAALMKGDGDKMEKLADKEAAVLEKRDAHIAKCKEAKLGTWDEEYAALETRWSQPQEEKDEAKAKRAAIVAQWQEKANK